MKKNRPGFIFPNPRTATADGLLAVGGDFDSATILTAYRNGIFPWPQEGYPMLWFSPDPRGVLDFKDFHVPVSLRKLKRKRSDWIFTINRKTAEVIRQCRLQPRKGQPGTWILPEMEAAYQALAKEGHILSLEAWDKEALVGGIYGVYIEGEKGRFFSGESMFHNETGASKLCLWQLVEHLNAQGLSWIDTQMVTDVVKLMGGKYIPREDFLKRLGV